MLFKYVNIDGLNIFYREAGKETAPKLVLLGGFPASTHQYRNLIPALADRFHVVSPDYPGFGNSDMPDPAKFSYTFDNTASILEKFLNRVGFTRFGLYVQDYGGPVGFRIVGRHPEWLEWFIISEHQCLRDRLYAGMGRASQQLLENPQRGVGKGNWRVSRARDRQGRLHHGASQSGVN